MMPHLSGLQLHARVLTIDPEQAKRFVFVSGGLTQPGIEEELNALPNEHLEKPVGGQQLRGVVRRYGAAQALRIQSP